MSQHEILFILCSYLLGSIPFDFIFNFFAGKKDTGTANIIAASVPGIVTGIIVVTYGLRHFDSPVTVISGGAAVVFGHMFPLFSKFKGGNGIAALVGVFMVFDFPSAVVFASVFLLTLFFTKYLSAGSIAGVTALFFFTLFTHTVEVSTIVLAAVLPIIAKHRSNIRRLAAGTENKFNRKTNG